MNCQDMEFSVDKSHQRVEKFLRVFSPELLYKIIAFALHLLGARRNAVATLTGMPEDSIKTMLRALQKDGFPAFSDRRQSTNKNKPPSVAPPQELQMAIDNEYCFVDFGIEGKKLKIPIKNKVHLRTVLLTLQKSGLATLDDVSSILGLTKAHCRELSNKLDQHGVTETFIDKRQGQKQDYLVGPTEKSELIKYFAAMAVTGRSTSSQALAEAINEANATSLSPRIIRSHMEKLGLSKIKKSLPGLVDSLKKNS